MTVGGRNKTTTKKVDYNKKAKAKVGSFDNFGHVPGGVRGKYSNTTKHNGQIHVSELNQKVSITLITLNTHHVLYSPIC